MIPNELAAMTGMARGKKKTRRGKRAGKHRHGNPGDHLKKAHDCLKSGDHAGCKQHAFALIKALPAKEREVIEAAIEGAEPPPKAPNPNTSSDARVRLALALKRKKA